jgi:O-antigen/teichoic acid export membrane protein
LKFLKTTFFSGLISFIKIISSFISGKAVAIYTGAAGVAFLGAFINFITIVLTFSNGAINLGVVKYTAELQEDEGRLKSLFSTSLKITLFCSFFVGAVLIASAPLLTTWIFKTDIFEGPITVLGVTVVLYSVNTLLLSILNGKSQIKTYTLVNTTGSIVSLVFTVVLVYFFKIKGALYAVVLAQSIVFFVTVSLVIRSDWFSWSHFKSRFDAQYAKKLSHYSLMAVVSAITVPVGQIILRNKAISELGIDSAGYWQGMMRISDGFLTIVITALSTYYLPKYSSLKSASEIRLEIFKGYKVIIPFMVLSGAIIFFGRVQLITVLFSGAFLPMQKLFFWQLIGDFFKVCAWILSYLMLAKSMTKRFVITEILASICYVLLGYLFVEQFNFVGLSMAFALSYFLYFLLMIFLFRKLLLNTSSATNEGSFR